MAKVADKEKERHVTGDTLGPKKDETIIKSPVQHKKNGATVPLLASLCRKAALEGWKKITKQRQTGKSAGKYDIHFIR